MADDASEWKELDDLLGIQAPADEFEHVHRVVTGNGACYRANDFTKVLHRAQHQRITRIPDVVALRIRATCSDLVGAAYSGLVAPVASGQA